MNHRLKQVRKELELNQTEFAEKLKMKQTSYSQIETGQVKLTEKNIDMICRVLNVSEYWLRTGKGEMFNDPLSAENDDEEEILALFRRLSVEMKAFVLKKIREIIATEEENWAEIAKQAIEDTPQGAKPEENTGIHPIHGKKRG
jgi:transcriptional regulator with XRE-family HTH domain